MKLSQNNTDHNCQIKSEIANLGNIRNVYT